MKPLTVRLTATDSCLKILPEKPVSLFPLDKRLLCTTGFTFMWINIPVIGWFYLFYLAFNKKYLDRQSFARAYLLYKLIFLIIGIIILAILIHIGMELLEQLLVYMEML